MKSILTDKWIVCRVCLRQPDETMESIFDNNDEKDMTRMILDCGGVPITRFDHYPDKICSKCLKCLRVAYQFRITCQRSHKHLRKLMAPVERQNDEKFVPIQVEENNDELVPKGVLTVLKTEPEEGLVIKEEIFESDFAADVADISKPIEEDPDAFQEFESIDRAVPELSDHVEYMEDIPETKVFHKHLSKFGVPVEMENAGEFVPVQVEEHRDELVPKRVLTVIKTEPEEDLDAADTADISKPIAEDAYVIEEFESIDRAVPQLSHHFEYMEDIPETTVINMANEEYLPVQELPKRGRGRPPKNASKIFAPKVSNPMEIKKQKPPPLKHLPETKKSKETQYTCEMCGKIFPLQCRLTEHIKWHKGIKRHKCEICGQGFSGRQQLDCHINTHTGNRPFKCNYCPSAFADVSTRNAHHRIHTKERPFVCDVCDKTFTYSSTLKFHKMIHTGEKPHLCNICGKGFTKAYKLRKHTDSHARKIAKLVKTETHGQDT